MDTFTWFRLCYLCWPEPVYGWDGEWESHRPELLSLVCAAPYAACESLDALMQRYAAGLVGAALGCQVTYESDRAEAVTAVVRAVAKDKLGVGGLSAEEVMGRAWAAVLAAKDESGGFKPFAAGRVHAPILGGSSSLALAPLRLRGARVTIDENTKNKLACRYTAADGSVAAFDGSVTVGDAVSDAGLRGVACADELKGLPAKPLPKPQDAVGREADIWLCVPGAEPFATAAVCFIVFTQPRDETVASTPSEAAPVKGDRVISLRVGPDYSGSLDLQGKPPMAELRFCEGSD